MEFQALLKAIFRPSVILGAVILAAVLLCLAISLLWITRPGPLPAQPPTAVLNVILAPTNTVVMNTPTPSNEPQTTRLVPPPQGGEAISVGAYVQISGTGGDGLRLRSEPSLQGDVKFLALEAEVFLVENGPRLNDEYTWWLLTAPYDASIQGWAVANYLLVVQNP